MKSYLLLLYRYREFIRQALIRNMKLRYKRPYLGILWSILSPFLLMTVMTIVFVLFIKIEINNYPVYLFSGLIPWQFFQSSLVEGADQLVSPGNILLCSKAPIPKAAFVIAQTTTNLIHALFGLAAILLFFSFFGKSPQLILLTLIPAFFLLYLFVLGVSFLVSVANVFFRDIQYLIPGFAVGLFYFSPIIYDPSFVPAQYRPLLHLNPIYYFLELVRQPIYQDSFPSAPLWGVASLFALFFLLSGLLAQLFAEDKILYHV